MLPYHAPIKEFDYLLNQYFAETPLHKMTGCEALTHDMIQSILEGAGDFASEQLRPLNHSGDDQGCHLQNGQVTTPEGFQAVYQKFCQDGWAACGAREDHGGQALPQVMVSAISEIMNSANLAFMITPQLTWGAYATLLNHADEWVKQFCLPKMANGQWSGVMCLTESHCGSDLGLLRTRALPNDKNKQDLESPNWLLEGEKIFISGGDHDLSQNIIYLVLARLPDAPGGVRGISLFLVPKFLPSGERNAVECIGLEHKMGIKASPTCTMKFEQAKAWLIGEPHKGLKIMFSMMNLARLGVAVQGTAMSEASYQAALSYAKERRQGRSIAGAKDKDQAADQILVHPHVRQMLMTIKANAEGSRALCLDIALHQDLANNHLASNHLAGDYVALLTPIAKAITTELASQSANLAMQIYGGHGYIKGNGVEQFVRDTRITQIYEGTNGIQALDLIGRKLGQHYGRALRPFFHHLSKFIEQEAENEALAPYLIKLAKLFTKLQQATAEIAKRGLRDQQAAACMADDYLWLFGYGWLTLYWVKTAKICLEHTQKSSTSDQAFYRQKLVLAEFFIDKLYPMHSAYFNALMSGKSSLMTLSEDEFV